jgi:hypothetical protein
MEMNISKKFLVMTILFFSGLCAFSAVPENETTSFEAQYKLAKNTSLPMSSRWKALLLASENATTQQIPQILEFSKDKDWFMRNATLVALEKMGTDIVYDKAKEMISDKALVVRSASAEILIKLNSVDVRRIFSEELSKKYNFNGSNSLWIRPQMMKFLVEAPTADERGFFVKYLFEKDQQMALFSVEALQKLTSVRFQGKTQTEVIAQWKSYAQQKKW